MCSAVMAPSPGPFFIFCSPCLHSFSIRLSHALFTGPTSVCTLSAGRGWLRELPLHIFITWTIFMWATRLSSAGDERGLERYCRCVGSAWSWSVFFMWLGWGPGLFHLSCFFPSLYLCTVGKSAFLLHILSSVSGRPFIGFFLSAACCCLSSSHSSGSNHVWQFLLSLLTWFSTQPFNLIVFLIFRTPAWTMHYFCLHFQAAVLPGFSLRPSIPSSFMSWAVTIISVGRAEQ